MTTAESDPRRGLQETHASPSDVELVELLERHGAEEGKILADYERYATEADSPAIRYLVQMILDDERRHHQVISEIASSVAWGSFGTDPAIVHPVTSREGDGSDLRKHTRRLLDTEKEDAQALKVLRKSLKDYKDDTIWDLLVRTMLLDTEKHQAILEFILSHTR